jgi:putative ABC transport system permease protein
MLHPAFIKRQVLRSWKQATVFVLCVVLSMISLIALNGFSASVHQALMDDARRLLAADMVIRSRYAFTPALEAAVARLAAENRIAPPACMSSTIVRTRDEDRSLLAMLKVAGSGYPFYGRVELASGRDFAQALQPGTVIVESGLLERLALPVGGILQVGAMPIWSSRMW